jgi:hypothetical protein
MSRLAAAAVRRVTPGDLIYAAIAACAVGFIAYVTLFNVG